jgi:glycine/D-amino acid oxidase-like deaminating enzyme/nitrite reductase/ring-hydroxylating ferredoxin subunit
MLTRRRSNSIRLSTAAALAHPLPRSPSMEPIGGRTLSVWMETVRTDRHARLERNAECDVCVVGAGIAGLTTAYLMARQGKRVIVLDDGPIGGGETGRTTAHLTNALDDRFFHLEQLHGEEGARLGAESHGAAIDRIEEIVRTEEIACDFRRVDGYLVLGPDHDRKYLERELEAAHRAGLTATRLLERAPLDGWDTGPCIHFPRQAQFHPLRYLHGLARALEVHGGRIFGGTHVEGIEGEERIEVKATGGKKVTAASVVVATNSPISDYVVTHVKQAPYRTYVIGAKVRRDSVAYALYWDTADPYHYVRLQPVDASSDVLIVGGEDHKTGQKDDAAERFARLETWTRERFPAVGEVSYYWSGQVLEPADGMGLIGRNPGSKNAVYIATGDSGQGMTHGTIAGILLTDLILGHDNPWAKLYDPSRVTLRAVGELAKENLNVAAQYTDWVKPGEVKSADDIPPESGAVLRRGKHRIATYRDASGRVHERNAKCTHLGCVVHWNSAEGSWDCPCHGSRFDPYGKVINPPAISPLEPAPDG